LFILFVGLFVLCTRSPEVFLCGVTFRLNVTGVTSFFTNKLVLHKLYNPFLMYVKNVCNDFVLHEKVSDLKTSLSKHFKLNGA